MNVYKGFEGDTVPIELLVKSSSESTPVKVVGVSASIIGPNVNVDIPGFVVKSDNLVYGLVGPEVYKAPGCYIAYVKCVFHDGSSKTFPVDVDIMSKSELTKKFMIDRWTQLAEQHNQGQDVLPEATRLLKSMEDGGYLTDDLKQRLEDMIQ